jgi:hypothetical protein
MNGPLRRRTHCTVSGHGTHCEAARDQDDYCRTTEERLALEFEFWAAESLEWAQASFAAQSEATVGEG